MYAQLDNECHHYLLLREITDHQKDHSAVPISEGMVKSAKSTVKLKVTMQGWELLVQWKDGAVSWEKLKILKESHQIEVAKYAVANDIVDEPAFKW